MMRDQVIDPFNGCAVCRISFCAFIKLDACLTTLNIGGYDFQCNCRYNKFYEYDFRN